MRKNISKNTKIRILQSAVLAGMVIASFAGQLDLWRFGIGVVVLVLGELNLDH